MCSEYEEPTRNPAAVIVSFMLLVHRSLFIVTRCWQPQPLLKSHATAWLGQTLAGSSAKKQQLRLSQAVIKWSNPARTALRMGQGAICRGCTTAWKGRRVGWGGVGGGGGGWGPKNAAPAAASSCTAGKATQVSQLGGRLSARQLAASL